MIVNTQTGKLDIIENDTICNYIKMGGLWEPFIWDLTTIIAKNEKRNNTAIDCGAHIGWHTIFFSKIFKKVCAFEPQEVLYDKIVNNVNINLLNNCFVYKKAVANVTGKCIALDNPEWYRVDEKILNYGAVVGREERGLLSVDTTTVALDDLFHNKNINEKVDLIKIDVQGMECEVIEGAKNIIFKCQPFMFIEIESENNLIKIKEMLKNFYIIYKVSFVDKCDYFFMPKINKFLVNTDNLSFSLEEIL